jgi:hypothetical protein
MKYLLTTFAAGLFASAASAATAIVEDFDAGAGLWDPNTTQTNVFSFANGGNPLGWLETDNFGPDQSFGAIGARATSGAYSGALPDGAWTVSVDLQFFQGDFDEARLRWRYQDFSHNGWYIPIETTTFTLPWTSYSVTFDTTWSDAQAIANGWVQEPTSAPFAALWDDLYTAEVRIVGTGAMEAGIDNYAMQPAPVPLPAGAVLMLTALGGLAATRRRNRT